MSAVLQLSPSNNNSNYFNREFSWLEFNKRVMHQAIDEVNPLLERVKFLAISASNIDEFCMVRQAYLLHEYKINSQTKTPDGLTIEEQVLEVQIRTKELVDGQYKIWSKLSKELEKNGINLIKRKDFDQQDSECVHKYFIDNLKHALTPFAIDAAHPFPHIHNLGCVVVLSLKSTIEKNKTFFAAVPLPTTLSRFVPVGNKYTTLDEAILCECEELFPNCMILQSATINIVRDTEIELLEDSGNFIMNFESLVKSRKVGDIIQIRVDKKIDQDMTQFLCKQFDIETDAIFNTNDMVKLADLMWLYKLDYPELKFAPYICAKSPVAKDFAGDIIGAIKANDFIIHHPYASFGTVIKFLEQAATDPKVVAIKQTLYRTGNESEIVNALITAAEAGKAVTVVMELKARFDEEANIKWARNLENAGAQVVFGLLGMKTHAKMSLVVRREKNKLVSYAHLSTGNYNSSTAGSYTDISYFTCKPDICNDVSAVFNYLTSYIKPTNLTQISASPVNIRSHLIELIDKEIEFAKQGKSGSIWIKANALVDTDLIDALYKASNAGVKINMVIRGICTLKPGIKGLSENIQVRSIIGRYLEHSRIYCFGNGGLLPAKNAKIFISSADWMRRNMDMRVEIMVPIMDEMVREQIMHKVMMSNLIDEKNSWELTSEGTYNKVTPKSSGFSSYDYFMSNPHLINEDGNITLFKKINAIREKAK
jgi:polyphosphate kinase